MTDSLIQGQIEALLPQLQAAAEAAKAAKAHEAQLREQIRSLLGDEPQTIKTVWGTVTLANGAKRQTVVCPILKKRLELLQTEGLATGATVIKVGEPTLRVTFA